MSDFTHRILPDWHDVLKRIVEQAATLREKAVLAFDLDSTLFDNRPRQSRILREYGKARGISCLEACAPRHWVSGWDMKAAMRSCGMPQDQVETRYPDAKKFWQERFFTSEYCEDDVAIEGASDFTHEVVRTGAILAYVTGRHEAMRKGTVEAMRRAKMALPGEGNTRLLMKPTLEENDDAYKRLAHEQLRQLGTVIAAFDNEPTHANDYRSKFPHATVIHLATDHSGRPVEILEGIVSVPHFDYRRR